MPPFSRPATQTIITSTILWTTLAALAGFVLALVTSAAQVSSDVAGSVRGPLGLFQIQKTPLAGGGFQASISLLPGLYWYATAAFAVAGILCALRLHSRRQTD